MDLVNDASVRQAAEAIERIGYGQSQVRALVLGAGAAYIAEKFDSDLTGLAAELYGVPPTDSWPTAMRFLMLHHIELGILAGFFLGDVMGRRWLIVRALGLAAVCLWTCIISSNYYVFTAANVLAATSLRAIFVTGLVITSECAPRDYRILHRALGVDCLNMSCVILGLVTVLHLGSGGGLALSLLPSAVFCSVFFGLSARLLPESPAFLAGAGRRGEAQEELDRMREVNGATVGSGEAVISADGCTGRTWSLRERLEALVTRRRGRALLLMILSLMAVKKGTMDAEAAGPPAFFSKESLGEWYETASGLIRICGEVFAFANATYFPRHVALASALGIYALTAFVFVVFNPLRANGGGGLFVAAVAEFAAAGLVYGCRIVLTVGYQICLEFWPTMSAVTAASVAIGAGYTKFWLSAWPWMKSAWPVEMSPMLDVMQLVLLVPLAYSARELQKAAEGVEDGDADAAGKAAPYGTFKQAADA